MLHNSEDIRTESAARDAHPHLFKKVCAICRRILTVDQEVREGLCHHPECRRRRLVQTDLRKQREKDAALRQAAMEFRTEVATRRGLADPLSLRLALIPHYQQPLVKLSRKRRAKFRAHLAEVLREAFAGESDSDADLKTELSHHARPSSEDAAIGASCAVCTGFCCRRGGTRAYLDLAAIRSFVMRHPEMRFREVWKAYIGLLPDTTCEDSCVYHGPRGCTLPREMRSSVCNNYFCGGMSALRAEIASEGPKTVLLAAADGTKILKSALIEPDGKTVPLDVPAVE